MMKELIWHIISWAGIYFFLWMILIDFIKERVRRGIWVGIVSISTWTVLGIVAFFFQNTKPLEITEVVLGISLLILLIPQPESKQEKIDLPDERIDERDVMFARSQRKPGMNSYTSYYTLRPHLKKTDDHLRSLPGLCNPESLFYDPDLMRQADQYFEDIEKIVPDEETVHRYVNFYKASSNPEKAMKKIVRELGAVDVGIAPVLKEFVYTYKGRFEEDYGKKVRLNHPTAIVFLVEMDYHRMQDAPYAATVLESARQYYRAARIAKYLEKIIQQLGCDAKAQYDAHYDMILPPLAVLAGLGEIGRNNILISEKWGSRVRIGAVITNMNLKKDRPIHLNAEKFCKICKKCATSCPSKSLLLTDKIVDRGIKKWVTRQETCYAYWRRVGTDCGICMAHCPYSKPNTFFHNLIRKWIRYSRFFPYVALWMDDWIYGKQWKNAKRTINEIPMKKMISTIQL
jgi:reductive dehalogenase